MSQEATIMLVMLVITVRLLCLPDWFLTEKSNPPRASNLSEILMKKLGFATHNQPKRIARLAGVNGTRLSSFLPVSYHTILHVYRSKDPAGRMEHMRGFPGSTLDSPPTPSETPSHTPHGWCEGTCRRVGPGGWCSPALSGMRHPSPGWRGCRRRNEAVRGHPDSGVQKFGGATFAGRVNDDHIGRILRAQRGITSSAGPAPNEAWAIPFSSALWRASSTA